MKRMDWIPVPNKHDGDGYTELLTHKNGTAHYGAWHQILQVASKCAPRGTLLRDGAGDCRRPHTAESIARITRGDERTIAEAIIRLVKIGWLEVCDNPAPSCGNPAPSCGEVTTEGNGTEGNGREEVSAPPRRKRTTPLADDAEWLAGIKTEYGKIGVNVDTEMVKARAWLTSPRGRGRKFTQQFFLNWLSKCDRNIGGAAGDLSSPLKTEWMTARDAAARAVWDAKDRGENIGHAIRVVRDKFRDVPKLDGKDAVTCGVDLAMNNQREKVRHFAN